jgi:hypothetical protein
VSPRRQLALVVVGCAAAAVLALVAAGRAWEVVVTLRPSPLPDLRVERTGGDLRPWLPALGWVGLAGAGALLATRGAARRLVGGLLVLAGVGLVVAGGSAVVAARSPVWPVLAGLAGLVVAGAGAVAVAGGRHWPVMGARYQRPAGPGRVRDRPDRPAGDRLDQPGARPEALWDALDRGEDPTAR